MKDREEVSEVLGFMHLAKAWGRPVGQAPDTI